MNIKPLAIIGLGNPGPSYYYQRHNIGFRIVDALAQQYNGRWQSKDLLEVAKIIVNEHQILLLKPQTFMNSSGQVISWLKKQNVLTDQILVVHDELEKPFGTLAFKMGGSHRGHNGLRSIIEQAGDGFARLRVGIGRPADKSQVPHYVLKPFEEPAAQVEEVIRKAVGMIEELYK